MSFFSVIPVTDRKTNMKYKKTNKKQNKTKELPSQKMKENNISILIFARKY